MRNIKIIYENDRGESVVISNTFPYLLKSFIGGDGAEANITSSKGVGQDGSTITNVNLKERHLQIIGVIKDMDKSTLIKRKAKLLQVFNPKVQGWLQYEYGDVKKRIRCQVESAPTFSMPFNVFSVLYFVVDLVAPNPYWQDINATKAEIAVWRGAFKFPLRIIESGIKMGFREPNLIVNIENKGDVSCGMEIRFKALATVINPYLFNINTREQFKINKTMEAGEVITVTTHFQNKKMKLAKNGVTTNAFNWINPISTFMQLETGDNLLRYGADEGIDSLEVDIYFIPQYLGV